MRIRIYITIVKAKHLFRIIYSASLSTREPEYASFDQ